MSKPPPPNADASPGLPLPLAQLSRRAQNAKTPLERLLTAGYLWEATLKLTAAAAVAEYVRRADPDPAISERLGNLAAPQLGHWREYLRLIPPHLAERGDDGYRRLWVALNSPRTDLPRCAELEAVFREQRDGRTGPRGKVRPNDLFDSVVWYRNKYTGHGAVATLGVAEQQRLAVVLLAAAAEFLECVDALARRRLVYVDRVEKAGGLWVVERFDLGGDFVRLPALEWPADHVERLPDADRVYLASPGSAAHEWALLSPLLVFTPDGDSGQVLYLNGCKGDGRRGDFLNYLSGEVRAVDLSRAWPPALAAALGAVPPAAKPRPVESPTPARPPEVTPAATRCLGEFELGELLGVGAMGEVRRARQLSLDREVAVKVLHRLGDRRAEARFSREVAALARVDHPNVVKVFASGSDGGRLFYAMELVEGIDLSAVFDRLAGSRSAELTVADWTAAASTAADPSAPGPVPPTEPAPAPTAGPPRWAGAAELSRVVGVVRQVAEAAHALHEAGVVHRDIKPNNVRLAADGRAVLLDLGLAQLLDESESRLTRTRQFVGTLRYASPEQVLSLRLDARADVYSLGATLWELLTLRPFHGATDATPTAELMLKIQTTEPDRVRRYNGRVPADLEAVVFKCLEKDRTRRYASAAELAADLGRWLAGEPVHAQSPSLGYLLRKHARRNKWPIAGGVAVVLAVAAGLVAAGTSAAVVRIDRARSEAEDAHARAVSSLDDARAARAAEEAARLRAEEAFRKEQEAKSAAQASFQAEQAAKRSEAVLRARLEYARSIDIAGREVDFSNYPRARALLAACPPELRGWEWGYVWQFLPAELDSLQKPRVGTHVLAIAVGPDGPLAVTSSGGRATLVRFPEQDRPGHALPGTGPACAGFNPDGSRVAVADGTVYVCDARTGKQLAEWKAPGGPAFAVAVDPEGKSVAVAEAGAVRVCDAQTGAERLVLKGHAGRVTAVAFSPDGYRLVTAGADRTARWWDAKTGKETEKWAGHPDWVTAVAFSPDGYRLVTAGAEGGLRVRSVWGSSVVTVPERLDGVVAVAYQGDGRRVVAGERNGAVRVWYVGTGGEDLRLAGHGGLAGRDGPVFAAAFGAGGARVITGGYDGTARVWDARTGRETHKLGRDDFDLPPGPAVTAAALDPAGWLAVVGRADRTAVVWDVESDQSVRPLQGHADWVTSAVFRPDGRRVATAGADGTARVWDPVTGQSVLTVRGHAAAVYCVAYSRDGGRLVTAGGDGTARVWDVERGSELVVLRGHDGDVRSAAFDRDGARVVTAGWDGTARVWDAKTGARWPSSAGTPGGCGPPPSARTARGSPRPAPTGPSASGTRRPGPSSSRLWRTPASSGSSNSVPTGGGC